MARNHRYVSMYPNSTFVPVVAILWPRHKAEQFLAWADSGVRLPGHPTPRADDGVVARWARREKQEFRVTVPSLVEHPDTVPTVKGGGQARWGGDRGRVALFLADDALDYEW